MDDDSKPEESVGLESALADRYVIEGEIGRGGMATVYRAKDLKHHRDVAIKVISPELGETLGPDRFLREIEIAARLQHPHILPLYDSGSAAGRLYYVMPLVEGESLRQRLNREKQLPQEELLKITAEVASALEYAHAHGIVHRDIKPENILLSAGTAVVADFGIARAVSNAGLARLTQTGLVVGTPVYMSPEQGTGAFDLDGRSDQYSLACVVYEMLVGQPPFTGPTPQAIIARHSMDFVSPPSIVRETIPATLEAALLRALAKVPADRFPTVAQFADTLATPSTITAAARHRSMGDLATGRSSPSLEVGWFGRRLTWYWAVPLVAGVLGIWLTRGLWLKTPSTNASPNLAPSHIAVLYFEDRSSNHSLNYLADGLTEGLIHQLSAVQALQVVSSYGVAPFKNTRISLDSIGRVLQVGTIVQGKVEKAGERLRVSVSMINPTSGDEIGSKTIEGRHDDVFVLQDSLAGEVTFFLRERLGQEVQRVQARSGTSSAAAWEMVQRAEELRKNVDPLLVTGDTAAASRQLAQADSALARAARLDQEWIAPLLGRGWLAFEERRISGFDKTAAAGWTSRGLDWADQALRLKPDDAGARQLRGTMRYLRWVLNLDSQPLTSDQLLASAEQDLRAGGAPANPRRASSLALLSHLLMRKSENAEGKLVAQQAYEADPYLAEAPTVVFRLFSASVDLEDGAEASKWCQEGFRRFPTDPVFTECQITLQALRGQRPDVARLWQLLDHNVSLYSPRQRDYRRRRGEILVAMALGNAGLRDSAIAVAVRARAGPDVDPTRDLVYLEVLFRSIIDDREEGVRLLAEYLATNPQDREAVANDRTWWLRGLRNDPRFEALTRRGR